MKFRLNINTLNPAIPPKAYRAQQHQQSKNDPKRDEWRYGYCFVEIEFLLQSWNHEVYYCGLITIIISIADLHGCCRGDISFH